MADFDTYLQQRGLKGQNAFSYGLAAAILDHKSINFIHKQKTFLGNAWNSAMRLAIVLFRDQEYGSNINDLNDFGSVANAFLGTK